MRWFTGVNAIFDTKSSRSKGGVKFLSFSGTRFVLWKVRERARAFLGENPKRLFKRDFLYPSCEGIYKRDIEEAQRRKSQREKERVRITSRGGRVK